MLTFNKPDTRSIFMANITMSTRCIARNRRLSWNGRCHDVRGRSPDSRLLVWKHDTIHRGQPLYISTILKIPPCQRCTRLWLEGTITLDCVEDAQQDA
jgi:hypothetical protein